MKQFGQFIPNNNWRISTSLLNSLQNRFDFGVLLLNKYAIRKSSCFGGGGILVWFYNGYQSFLCFGESQRQIWSRLEWRSMPRNIPLENKELGNLQRSSFKVLATSVRSAGLDLPFWISPWLCLSIGSSSWAPSQWSSWRSCSSRSWSWSRATACATPWTWCPTWSGSSPRWLSDSRTRQTPS